MSDYTPTTDEVRACSLLTQEGPQAVLDVQSPAGGRQEAFRMIHQFTDDELAAHDAIVHAMQELDLYPHDSSYRSNTADFLAAHPRCHLGIVDEYGSEHPITEESEDR